MRNLRKGERLIFKPDGIHEWNGKVVADIEEHENVTVIVSEDLTTGEISLGWKRQPNTIDHIYAEKENET